MNKKAIQIAKEVAMEPGNEHCLVGGNICNTNLAVANDKSNHAQILEMFREQCLWAKESGVDFILAETISCLDEALLALQAIREVGLPSIVNLIFVDDSMKTREGIPIKEAYKILKDNGADVVGTNCG